MLLRSWMMMDDGGIKYDGALFCSCVGVLRCQVRTPIISNGRKGSATCSHECICNARGAEASSDPVPDYHHDHKPTRGKTDYSQETFGRGVPTRRCVGEYGSLLVILKLHAIVTACVREDSTISSCIGGYACI